MQQETTRIHSRTDPPLDVKLREYILGREQEEYDSTGCAKRMTPTEAFGELLDTDQAKRARARAPTKKTKRDRL